MMALDAYIQYVEHLFAVQISCWKLESWGVTVKESSISSLSVSQSVSTQSYLLISLRAQQNPPKRYHELQIA